MGVQEDTDYILTSRDCFVMTILGVFVGGICLVAMLAIVKGILHESDKEMYCTARNDLARSIGSFAQKEAEIVECVSRGGIPIRSTWDGRLEHCEGLR